MEHFNFITTLLAIKDPNITLLKVVDQGTHKEIIAKLDYKAPKCSHCQGKMAKYDFQKASKFPIWKWQDSELVCSYASAVFDVKNARKFLSLRPLLSRKIIRFLRLFSRKLQRN